jgi:hypothetical protein
MERTQGKNETKICYLKLSILVVVVVATNSTAGLMTEKYIRKKT